MGAEHLDLIQAALLVCIGIVIGVLLDHYVFPFILPRVIGRQRRDGA